MYSIYKYLYTAFTQPAPEGSTKFIQPWSVIRVRLGERSILSSCNAEPKCRPDGLQHSASPVGNRTTRAKQGKAASEVEGLGHHLAVVGDAGAVESPRSNLTRRKGSASIVFWFQRARAAASQAVLMQYPKIFCGVPCFQIKVSCIVLIPNF